MTRFARASGSKASNQRVPEDSTPWFLLKQQVAKGRSDSEQNQEPPTDWKSTLDTEKKIEENKKSVWCEFEVEKPKSKSKGKVGKRPKKRVSESNNPESLEEEFSTDDRSVANSKKKCKSTPENGSSQPDSHVTQSDLKSIKAKLKLPKKPSFQVEEVENEKELEDREAEYEFPQPKKKKFKRASNVEDFATSSSIAGTDEYVSSMEHEKEGVLSRKTKKNKLYGTDEYVNQFPGTNSEFEKPDENSLNIKTETCSLANDAEKKGNNNSYPKRNNTITWKMSNKKERNSQPYNRRKRDEGDVKLEINGQEIWVTKLDGFYIKKEDAERIRQLEKDLLRRGVSKQEVRAVVKKERRNAEKSLARQKKKVCYHCRKGGHTLSSCPKLEENGAQVVGSGICYKCGSTEHTHFQCKVSSGDSYKFATCFVCKQEGHISKQCPDNPRGMYPTGGGCRLCGDVTHFRRECPTLQAKSNKVTVGLIGEDIETLGDQAEVPTSKQSNKGKKNKIIKFS